jgi:flagellar motor switch protein FliN/FliY
MEPTEQTIKPESEAGSAPPPSEPVSAAPATAGASRTAGLLMDIDLPIRILFGSTRLRLRDILALKAGSVVELDRPADGPVEILVSNRIVARGQVIVVDGNYGVQVTEIVKPANDGDLDATASDLLRLAQGMK